MAFFGDPDSFADPPYSDFTAILDICRSSQVRIPSSHLNNYQCYSTLATFHEPRFFCEAISNSLAEAMSKEFHALTKTNTWDLVGLPPKNNAVGCK